MPYDAVLLRAVLEEISPQVVGARIDKIYMPGRDEVVLSLRGREGSARLLLTANPAHPRIQLTGAARDNPATPPMFCMLLRKHLTGARILSVTQPGLERVARMELEVLDELGDRSRRLLILEAIGRHSNLILADEEGRIVDCLHRVDGEMSEKRQVLPGLYYRLPPAQEGKRSPLETGEEEFARLLGKTPGERKVSDFFLDHFLGLSPLICRELASCTTGDVDGRLWEADPAQLSRAFFTLCNDIKEYRFTPCVISLEGIPREFSYREITQYGPSADLKRMDSFSQLLDFFYARQEGAARLRQKGSELIRSVTSLRDRTARKLDNQRRELDQAEHREEWRIRGDLITANLYAMEKGMKELRCTNYYDPEGREVTIPLDPLLTPQRNAAACYKRYRKAKTAHQVLQEQIALGEADLEYLDSVLAMISCATQEQDLLDIRRELEEGGYLKVRKNAKKQMKPPKSRPLEFCTTAGMRVSVGRSNLQNDQLTCRLAGREDIWLHTQGIPGSHVILWTQGQTPDAESLTQAAQLAAWFSQGREDSRVSVDYTQVRYVKKPAGAKPGKVLYTHYATARVAPDRDLAEKLQKK